MRYAGNIHQFNQIFVQEKVFLQFDNTSYFQGETIWFKAFVMNASTGKRSRSTVLYVDLISPGGILLEQKKLKIVAGQADGYFSLMDGGVTQATDLRGLVPYPSGYYEIRAYTQYMMNFSENLAFSRVLPVFKEPLVQGNYSNPAMEQFERDADWHRPEAETESDVSVTLYPEGGTLLVERPSRVAFKATGKDGMPVDGTLTVSGGLRDDISASTVHDGMGSIYLTAGYRGLKAEFKTGGKAYKVKMPKPTDKGYAMILSESNDSLRVRVFRGYRNKKEEEIGITVTCRGELAGFDSFTMSSDSAHCYFSMEGWPVGVYQLTVYNLDGILSTRHFFHYREDLRLPQLEVSAPKDSYSPFVPMHLDFTLRDGRGKPFRDRFCVSVHDLESAETSYQDDLATSMLLSSDLKGLILNPQYYFESFDDEHRRAMDLLTLVQGWERYDWMYMTNNSFFVEEHRMEDSLSVNGWITSYWNNKKKLEGVNAYVTVDTHLQDSTVEFGMYTTQENGYFGFNVKDYYGSADLVVLLENKGNYAYGTGANLILQRAELPELRAYFKDELCFSTDSRRTVTSKVSASSGNKLTDIDKEAIPLPEVEILAPRKYIDYFTFKAFDVEQDVETVLDFGKWPTDLLGYFLEKGYTASAQGGVSINSKTRTGNSSVEIPIFSGGFGEEGYAFDATGYLGRYPVFWYIHNSNKLIGASHIPAGWAVEDGGFDVSNPWAIDTEDVESILVFDDPASLKEISESVPLFMDAIDRHINTAAQMAMSGSVTNLKYILVDVLVKDDYKLRSAAEKKNRGKRITTLRGFSYPMQFYSPQYPDGPIEGTKDYRRTLYWNPNVVTDENGHAEVEFYNNSYSTHFRVTGAGITASGTPYVLDSAF